MSKKSVSYVGPFYKVKGSHIIEIMDSKDPDCGVKFRNMMDGNWPIIGGLIRKDKGQVTVAGSTLVKVYR